MLYRYLLSPALLSVALLMPADVAQAQGGKGGRGGAPAGGRGGYSGAYRGGAYHGPYYGNSYYRSGFGIGIGVYAPLYPYSAYPYYDPYIVPRVAYYPAPAVAVDLAPTAPIAPAVAADIANIRVLVPDPQAKVLFDGSMTKQDGTDRLFHTPAISPGGNYSYRIRASWTQNGQPMVQEQVANVAPGRTTVVDFTRPLSEPLPAPK